MSMCGRQAGGLALMPFYYYLYAYARLDRSKVGAQPGLKIIKFDRM